MRHSLFTEGFMVIARVAGVKCQFWGIDDEPSINVNTFTAMYFPLSIFVFFGLEKKSIIGATCPYR